MSDQGVADGGLAECANLILDNGELAPIVPPKVITSLPTGISYDLLFIHKSPGFTGQHAIALYDGSIYYVTNSSLVNMLGSGGSLDEGETIKDIKAVGNTVIVSTSSRLRYFLWKSINGNFGYSYLGSNIPSLDVKATVTYESTAPTVTCSALDSVSSYLDVSESKAGELIGSFVDTMGGDTIVYPGEPGYSSVRINSSEETTAVYADEIATPLTRSAWTAIGTLVGQKRQVSKINTPIFLRCALRMFDGSYTHQTVPILLGAESASSYITSAHIDIVHGDGQGEYLSIVLPKFYSISLQVTNAAAIAAWSDIIKGVDIFLSEQIYLNKYDGKIREVSDWASGTSAVFFESMTGDEKRDELLAKSNFYRVQQIDIKNLTDDSFTLDNLSKKLGDNLLTMPTLPDDYRSNHEVWAEKMFEMNSRLNILNISTRYFDGPSVPASLIPTVSGKTVKIHYRIRGEGGTDIVTEKSYGSNHPGAWLAYPDTRCYMADVYITTGGTKTKASIPMTEHPLLNCAYAFLGFGITDLSEYAGVTVSSIPSVDAVTDHAYNKIFQSAVDNPYFFPLGGRHSISGGAIIGVASTTKALSQGQFGQFPLYVFCEEGIWAMQTATDGTFQSIAPVSRVVCNNANSITGIDGAVVFTSDRGLMLLAGSDVQCLSEDMIGEHFRADSLTVVEEIAGTHFGSTLPGDASDDRSFVDYAEGCYIAYDFANARLILTHPSCVYQYVYALKDRTWHKMCFDLTFKRTVNSYPDCYLQCESNSGDAVYNFSIIDDVNDIYTRTFGLAVTRALDFDDPYVLKTVQAIRHRINFKGDNTDNGDNFCYVLYGSRDGTNYKAVRSLKGSSYKFYRLALLARLLPTERINRTTVEFDEKFNNKLR